MAGALQAQAKLRVGLIGAGGRGRYVDLDRHVAEKISTMKIRRHGEVVTDRPGGAGQTVRIGRRIGDDRAAHGTESCRSVAEPSMRRDLGRTDLLARVANH